MYILLIDDNVSLVEQIQAALQEEQHIVVACGLGEEGLRLALGGGFQLIVLDIHLPDRDGWSILAELKRQGVTTPVLILTEEGQLDDRVKGFDLGADDYLPKPFDFRELLGRVRAILRRFTVRDSRIVSADMSLDLDTHTATRAGKALHLAPNEFRALLLLLQAKGRPVTRQELSDKVLGRKHSGNSNAIEVLIRRLRLKVDEGFEVERILTVRGVGYCFLGSAPPSLSSTA